MKLFLSIFIFFWTLNASALPPPTPIGYWQIMDTMTQKPRLIVQIKESNHELIGQIVKANQPSNKLLGFVILSGFKQDKNQPSLWREGYYFDPYHHKKYRCILQMTPQNNQLIVRFSTGLPLLGHSERWVRVPNLYW